MSRLSERTADELTEKPADDDLIHIVDRSDTTHGAGGTSKPIKHSNYTKGLRTVITVGSSADSDHVTDGSNDEVQIQAAIDAADAAGGGTVFIKAGTYSLASQIQLSGINNVLVKGEGMGVTVIQNSGFNKNSGTRTDNIGFEDLTVDVNNIAGTNAMNFVNNSYNFWLTRVELKNTNDKFLLHWGGMENFIARDCRFIDGGLTVAADNCAGSQLPTTDGQSKFKGCYFECTSNSQGSGLLTTGQSGNLLFEGNTFVDSGDVTYAAISTEHQEGDSKTLIIKNNYCYGTGIETGVSGNSDGNSLIIIEGNILEGDATSAGGGIKVDDGILAKVVNNVISGTTYGIHVTNTNTAVVEGNIIKNTNIDNASVDFDKGGFYLSGNTQIVKIIDNVVTDDSGKTPYGIRIAGGANRVYLENNKFRGPFTADALHQTGTQDYLYNHGNEYRGSISLGTITEHDVQENIGYTTENSGTATITSGTTSVVVNHGLNVTPTYDDISVTMAENPTNDPGNIWVDTITSSQFTINCRNDPGASNLDLGWQVRVLPSYTSTSTSSTSSSTSSTSSSTSSTSTSTSLSTSTTTTL